MALAACPSVMFSTHDLGEGGVYAVLPHTAMVSIFGAVSLFVLTASA